MMRRTKSITVLFAAAMAVSLAACGEAQDIPAADSNESAKIRTEASGGWTEAPDIGEDSNAENESKAVQAEEMNTSAYIEETVLWNENDVVITATELSYTSYYVELELTIENNSDKNLSFICGSMGYSCNAINGYMVDDGYLNADVAAGKMANESIHFSKDGLAIYGITEIADIQLGFQIQDDDYNSSYSGPRQVRTSVANSYDYAADTYTKALNSGALERAYNCAIDYFAEDELYHQEGVRIVSEALMTNKNGEKVILLEVQNDSQELVYGVTSDISLNGLVVCSSVWSSDSINPGARRVIDLSLSSLLDESYWEAFGFSEAGDFACAFSVKNADYEEINAPQEISIAMSGETIRVDDTGMEVYHENDIRIISKGLFEDSSSYSDDIHMLFLVENNYSETVSIDDSYNSFSVNGIMTDCTASGREVPSGKFAILDVKMWESSLENNHITGIEDIADAEITFVIKDSGYDTIAKPVVTIDFSH